MSRHRSLLLIAALALAAPAAAAAQSDHVTTRVYVEHEVVSISGRPDFQSTILFGEGERIENIAVGQSGTWQVTPNRRANLLFVKPVTAAAPATNMTVVTDRHTYLFDLRASARATPVYLLRFAYPEAPSEPQAPAEPEAGLIAAATPALPLDALNFAWSMSGAHALFPERCFDDGSSVYLAWGPGRALPAILSIGPDGKTEGPVNFAASGEYLVVEGFHKRLILRSGKAMASLETHRTAPADVAIAAQTE